MFNVAMPTASLATYRTMIDHAARLGMKAGTMIAGVCMENDLALHGSAGSSRRVSADPRVAGLKERLKRKSAAYFMFTTVAHRVPVLRAVFVRLGLIVPVLAGMPRNAYSAEVLESSASALRETLAETIGGSRTRFPRS